MGKLTLIILSVALGANAVFAEACFEDGEREQMLTLDVKTFDQTQEQGWRLIADRECYSEAAALIAEYRASSDDSSIKDGLRHHQMQMHAAGEEREKAVQLLDDIIPDLVVGEDDSEIAYKKATRAFLAGDRSALEQARADLASLPVPEGFKAGIERFAKEYPGYPLPKWPLNLDVVDGLLNCFDEPYNIAYSSGCRPSEENDTGTK